jgi:hypothetical protein
MAKEKRKGKQNKKSKKPEKLDDVSDAWLEFSKEISDEILKRTKEGAKEYENFYKIWEDYAKNMSEKLAKFSLDDEEGIKEMQELWNIYSDKLEERLGDLFSKNGSPYKELFQICSSYSDKRGECLIEIMNKRMEEQREMYELWMDSFAFVDKDIVGTESGIFDAMDRLLLEMWDKQKDLFQLSGQDTKVNEKLRELNELWTQNYSKMVYKILKSDAFTRMNGTILDRNMEIRRWNEQFMNQYLNYLGMPTKDNINEIYKKLHEMDRKLSQISRSIDITHNLKKSKN